MYLYLILYVLFFAFVSVDNIHLFQLNSYRYSRYFRWLFPSNIMTTDRLLGIILLAAALPLCNTLNIVLLILLFAIKFLLKRRKKGNQKTPLVFTNRVKRLYTTTLLIYIVVVTATTIAIPKATLHIS